MKGKVKISAVSYLNTLPFMHGIKNDENLLTEIELSEDFPSVCADKLISGEVDLGLIPVAEIPKLKNPQIISNYCLGAVGKVDTVSLFSHIPVENVKTVLLDYQSRTSVQLTRILAEKYFKINPDFVKAEKGYEDLTDKNSAVLIIGDRVFKYKNKFEYNYDLSEIWLKYTSYPFVFAAWTANKMLDAGFIQRFNNALKKGISEIDDAIKDYQNKNSLINVNLEKYLKKSISYNLDNEKRKGMQLFLDMLKNKI